jgi:hypothetical protein
MSYQNTGYARNKTLIVTKGDYTQSYNICAAFTAPGGKAYNQLSDSDFARLRTGEYEQRRSDFIAYVYSLEDGLQNDCPNLATGSVVYDPVSCPIEQQADQ